MKCPKCKSNSVIVQMVDAGSSTSKSGPGLAGNAYNAYRAGAAIVTLGMSNLILPKAKGKEKTKNKLIKMAICQNCGHNWKA